MISRAAATALILLASTWLLPQASSAIEGIKLYEIGHLGDKIEAMVEISSDKGRTSAIPLVRVKEDPERAYATASEKAESGMETLAKFVPDGDISLTRGRKLLDRAREAFKKLKAKKAESPNGSLPGEPAGRAGAGAVEETQTADDEAGSRRSTINLCENCNYRLTTNTSIH